MPNINFQKAFGDLNDRGNNLQTFISYFLNSNYEREALSKMYPNPRGDVESYDKYINSNSGFLTLGHISNILNRKIMFTPAQIIQLRKDEVSFMLGANFFARYNVPMPTKILSKYNHENCHYKGEDLEDTEMLEFYLYFQCRPNTHRFKEVLNNILVQMDRRRGEKGSSESADSFSMRLIVFLGSRDPLTKAEVDVFVDFAKRYVTKVVDVQEALVVEGIAAALQSNPARIALGGWPEFKPVQYAK